MRAMDDDIDPPKPSRADADTAPISEGRHRRRIVVRSLASIAVLGAIAATVIVFGNFFTATYSHWGVERSVLFPESAAGDLTADQPNSPAAPERKQRPGYQPDRSPAITRFPA